MTNFEIFEVGEILARATGGTPGRSEEQVALIKQAAATNDALKVAASDIHAAYYGNSAAKAEDDPKLYDNQVGFIAKTISKCRRGLFPASSLT